MKKRAFFFSFLFLFAGGLSWYSASFFAAKKYTCVIDSSLSDETHISLENHIAEALKNKVATQTIIQELQEKFPVIKKITIAYLPSSTHVTVRSHEPLCLINDSVVMTHKHDLFAKNIFSSDVLDVCPSITVSQESMSSVQLLLPKIFKVVPADFYQLYDLVVVNEYSLRFIDKADPQFVIVYSVGQHFSPDMISQCDRLKKNMIACGSFNKGVEWIADMRFADYIVTYKG